MTQQLITKSYEASRNAFVAESVQMGRNPRPSKEISNRYYYLFQISIAASNLEASLSIANEALDYVLSYTSIARKVKIMSERIAIIMAELSKSVEFDATESVVFLDEYDISPEWNIILSKADNKRAASEAAYIAALVADIGGNSYCSDPEAETDFGVYSALPHCMQRLQSADYHLRMAELRCLQPKDLATVRSLIYACAKQALE